MNGGNSIKKYLAFDIETAKVIPESENDLLSFRPLGICCAAAVANDLDDPIVWHGRLSTGEPSEKMSASEVCQLVHDLSDLNSKGYTIATWNGLAFDFDVIAEESGLHKECSRLAMGHVDLLFHAFCILGYRVSLQKAADGMGLRGKLAGMGGDIAPQMWASGEHKRVIDYCIQDVRATLELAVECDKQKQLRWITQQGKLRRMPLPEGWKTIEEALRLPEVDTSWMTDPPKREQFTQWMK